MLLFALLLGPLWAAETVSLNGEWRLRLAATPAEADQLARFHEPGFDASAFRPIPVPANWTLHGFEAPLYGTPKEAGEGFYLHRFAAPAAAGQRVLLHFGGVWASAEVWLNGRNLGRHDSGFTGFAFDVTKALKPENTLAVRVRQITKDSSLRQQRRLGAGRHLPRRVAGVHAGRPLHRPRGNRHEVRRSIPRRGAEHPRPGGRKPGTCLRITNCGPSSPARRKRSSAHATGNPQPWEDRPRHPARHACGEAAALDRRDPQPLHAAGGTGQRRQGAALPHAPGGLPRSGHRRRHPARERPPGEIARRGPPRRKPGRGPRHAPRALARRHPAHEGGQHQLRPHFALPARRGFHRALRRARHVRAGRDSHGLRRRGRGRPVHGRAAPCCARTRPSAATGITRP